MNDNFLHLSKEFVRGVFSVRVHRDTTLQFFWGAPEFQGAYHVLFSFLSLGLFLCF